MYYTADQAAEAVAIRICRWRRSSAARPASDPVRQRRTLFGVESVVGREVELDAVESFLGGASRQTVVAIVGEPGIGKSTVWAECVARARSRDASVAADGTPSSYART